MQIADDQTVEIAVSVYFRESTAILLPTRVDILAMRA